MRNRNISAGAVGPWYAVELPISYQASEDVALQGDGRTVAISSSAVRFACEHDLPVGAVVWLAIQWPAKLADGSCLSLSAAGTIRTSALGEIEVAIAKHEFRTLRDNGMEVV